MAKKTPGSSDAFALAATGGAAVSLANARAMFRRVLASWAQDTLVLRSSGLSRPGAIFRVGARGATASRREAGGHAA